MSELALVTGASSGIGKAFAQRLDELVAFLPQVNVHAAAADLSTDDGMDTSPADAAG